MTYKYLVFSGIVVWGKNEISKEYFVNAVQRGDQIVNVAEGTYFDKDANAWQPLQGDE